MKSIILLIVTFCAISFAADTITVGVSPFPPCVITGVGAPTGFDIELFQKVAEKAKINYKFKVIPNFPMLLDDIKAKRIDLGISGITITSDREQEMDFSHPYLNSGLLILAKTNNTVDLFSVMGTYLKSMKGALFSLLGFLIICGIIIWLFERKGELFNKNILNGIGDGIYWTNVTMSTVGYGDKYPKTGLGKLFAIIVMWIGIGVVFPYVIAAMNNAFSTEVKLHNIENISDLENKRVGTEVGTTTEKFLQMAGAKVITKTSIDKCYPFLLNGDIDAVVFDMPSIKYYVQNSKKKDCSIVGELFEKQSYGFALPEGSKLREPINIALLDFMQTDEYQALQKKWFGD